MLFNEHVSEAAAAAAMGRLVLHGLEPSGEGEAWSMLRNVYRAAHHALAL